MNVPPTDSGLEKITISKKLTKYPSASFRLPFQPMGANNTTIMTYQELIEKSKAGRVDFYGNVIVSSIWNGVEDILYYAQYADEEGIHACPEGEENEIECFEPISFDDVDLETLDKLIRDIIC